MKIQDLQTGLSLNEYPLHTLAETLDPKKDARHFIHNGSLRISSMYSRLGVIIDWSKETISVEPFRR